MVSNFREWDLDLAAAEDLQGGRPRASGTTLQLPSISVLSPRQIR